MDKLLGSPCLMEEVITNEGTSLVLHRYPRRATKAEPQKLSHACDFMTRTELTPFMAIVLLRSSGRYIGLGTIIDRRTILTASKVVEAGKHSPGKILILLGRLSPWWGKYAQVREAVEIYVNDVELAIVKIKKIINYNINVSPVPLANKPGIKDMEEEYDHFWAIFGIVRSSWDIPGDPVEKSSAYEVSIESSPQKKEDMDACKAFYPDYEYNDTINLCTFANATFCWGCVGSPLVAVDKGNKISQIGVLTRTTYTERDEFHVHVRVDVYDQWIRTHSLLGLEHNPSFN